MTYVRELATATLKTCVVAPGAKVGDKTNSLGFPAITPGGYPAIWILDFTMNFSSGLIAREDGLRHLQLILEKQNGAEPTELGKQVVIPAYAIPDHINVDGTPVFFPGTYDPMAHMDGDLHFLRLVDPICNRFARSFWQYVFLYTNLIDYRVRHE